MLSVKALFIALVLGVVLVHAQTPAYASVPVQEPRQPYWPFNPPSRETLKGSDKKVLSHYFPAYPLRLVYRQDPFATDYYSRNYLKPEGEGGDHVGYGGFFRQRPLEQPKEALSTFVKTDLKKEITRAIALGLDGFFFDILTSNDVYSNTGDNRLKIMLDTALATDSYFKIALMPDMEVFKTRPQDIFPYLKKHAKHAAAYKIGGKTLIAPFNAHKATAAWWKAQLDDFAADGYPNVFLPVLQFWKDHLDSFAPFSIGISDWGTSTVSMSKATAPFPKIVHDKKKGLLWMQPVLPQGFRPKKFMYWENHNSETFRAGWETAINNGSDWVQLITWNDYSEATEISPSTGTRYAFYDLTAYYTTWFKTGKRPTIVRDVLYYFHRVQHTDIGYTNSKQEKGFTCVNCVAKNDIEIYVFLKKTARIGITFAGKTTYKVCPAGRCNLFVPFTKTQGGTPVFSIIRDGTTILKLTSSYTISTTTAFTDLLYRSGGFTLGVSKSSLAVQKSAPDAVVLTPKNCAVAQADILSTSFAPQSSDSWSFTITATPQADTNISSWVGLALGEQTDSKNFSAIIRFAPNGLVQAYNGNEQKFAARTTFRYDALTTYTLKFTVNFTAQTYAAIIQAPEGAAVYLGRAYGFQVPATKLDTVAIRDSTSESGKGVKYCDGELKTADGITGVVASKVVLGASVDNFAPAETDDDEAFDIVAEEDPDYVAPTPQPVDPNEVTEEGPEYVVDEDDVSTPPPSDTPAPATDAPSPTPNAPASATTGPNAESTAAALTVCASFFVVLLAML